MKHLFNPHMFKNIVSLLILLLILKGFWFVVGIVWLPSGGEEHAEQKGAKPLYYRVKLTPNEAPAPIITALEATTEPEASNPVLQAK